MARGRLTPSRSAAALVLLLLTACAGAAPDREPGERTLHADQARTMPDRDEGHEQLRPPDDFSRLEGVTDLASLPSRPDTFAAWRDVVPRVEDVRIPSSVDDNQQPALWLAPRGDEPQPLIVALHSWSTRYVQWFSSPYGRWADQEGWAMVAPDFRGAFRRPTATGSDTAVQDVVDAIEWATARDGVDPERVFVVGFSGGGMMSLLMAGRHPELLAGAVSWVPVVDLTSWYAYNRDVKGGNRYAREIERSCGGDPTRDAAAREECAQRSPEQHLDEAREADLPVLIGHGLRDRTVLPDSAVRAFDLLADEEDRLGLEVREAVADNRLPPEVPGEPAEDFFAPQDPEVLLARRSGDVTLVLFDGKHNMVFHPGLAFMAAVAEREGS